MPQSAAQSLDILLVGCRTLTAVGDMNRLVPVLLVHTDWLS